MLAGVFSLVGAAYYASSAVYRWMAAGMAGAAWYAAHLRGQDLVEAQQSLAYRAHRRTASSHWRKAGRRWDRFGQELSESMARYRESLRTGWSHSMQALRGVPRSQWQPPPPSLSLSNGLNPLGVGFTIGFMVLAGHAAARRAEAEGRDPRMAAVAGTLSSGLTMLAQQVVFGSSLVGAAAGLGAYLVYHGWSDVGVAIKHGARYRESYVRASAAPWSFSSEPTDVAYQMMLAATRNTLGYETGLGMEAAPMAARYGRG